MKATKNFKNSKRSTNLNVKTLQPELVEESIEK